MRTKQKQLNLCFVGIIVSLLIIFANFNAVGQDDLNSALPSLKAHPLPNYLQNWQIKTESGDYLREIQPHLVGYFIFSQFPIKVYLDQPLTPLDTTNFSQLRFQQWLDAVRIAIADWHQYLPLVEVKTEAEADILIKRQHPPLKGQINLETGLYDLPRARSAETTYKFYLSQEHLPALLHRMIIKISPDQNNDYILAAARHELGHALGIWGHSDQQTDIMYFSQVRNPPPISARDINTLKKIYQQPTRLGWSLSDNS